MQHAAWSTATLQQQCSMQQWMTLVTCHEDDKWGVEVNRKIDIYLDYLWWLLAHLPSFFMRQVKLDEWEDCIWPAGPITVLTTMLLAALLQPRWSSHNDCNNSFTSWLYSKLIFSNQNRVQQVSSNGNVFLLHCAVLFALLTAQCPAPPVWPECNNWSFSINWTVGTPVSGDQGSRGSSRV